jgi:hypothetical protein
MGGNVRCGSLPSSCDIDVVNLTCECTITMRNAKRQRSIFPADWTFQDMEGVFSLLCIMVLGLLWGHLLVRLSRCMRADV